MPLKNSQHLTIWGTGELGIRVAERWVRAGGACTGITRTPQRHEQIKALGARPMCAADVHHIPEGALVIATPGAVNQREVVERLAKMTVPQRVVLCNSTACFMSQSPVRQRAALALEDSFFAWVGQQGTSLRFGGLFRAGRGPAASIRKGRRPPIAPARRVLPLIHYDDAATAVLNAVTASYVDPWYTLSVWPMPTRAEFYERASVGTGIEVEFEHWEPWALPEYEIDRTLDSILSSFAYPDWRSATE